MTNVGRDLTTLSQSKFFFFRRHDDRPEIQGSRVGNGPIPDSLVKPEQT